MLVSVTTLPLAEAVTGDAEFELNPAARLAASKAELLLELYATDWVKPLTVIETEPVSQTVRGQEGFGLLGVGVWSAHGSTVVDDSVPPIVTVPTPGVDGPDLLCSLPLKLTVPLPAMASDP